MHLLDKILPADKKKQKMAAIGLPILIAAPLTVWGIYGIGEYGFALFILTPFFLGLAPTILYGNNRELTSKEANVVSFQTLGIFAVGLLVCALEGIICILMAAPIALVLTWIGAQIGRGISNERPKGSLPSIVLLLFLIPTTAFIEKDSTPNVKPVITSVVIDASPETVWKNVIEFPQLDEPTEFLFNAGIAYPINATIEHEGVGAVRHCNFNTGSFVEPITVWDAPNLLAFDVLEQPEPMQELSFWDIDAPHLHDYFVSKKGQFKLTRLPNGQTQLEGTTWYYHAIKPDIYWRVWSDWIIHSIHNRVLNHIKATCEKEAITSRQQALELP